MSSKTEVKSKANKSGGQTLIEGALILTLGMLITKIIGAIYKLPIADTLGGIGFGYFNNAYALYNPVFVLAAAGFPSAIARMVSESMTLGKYHDVRSIQKVAQRVFFITGTTGTALMIAIGFFATRDNGPWAAGSFPAIVAMSPSVFLCCMMGTYRGYTEGMKNMTPTAVSQVIEALGKLVIGLSAAVTIVKYGEGLAVAAGLPQFSEGALTDAINPVIVFGKKCYSRTDAVIASYPWAAAGALMGITLGSALALLFLMVRMKKLGTGITEEQLKTAPKGLKNEVILRTFFSIGIPVALGMLALSVTQLIDAAMIQSLLAKLDISLLNEQNGGVFNPIFNKQYGNLLSAEEIANEIAKESANLLWGVYGLCVSIYTLVPSITQALGVSAIPALSSAWIAKDKKLANENITAVFKVTALLAFPAGMGIAFLAGPIISILNSKPEFMLGAPMLTVLGVAVLFGAFAVPVNAMLQAVGKQSTPVKLMLLGAVAKIGLNYTLVGIQSINIKGAPWGTLVFYAIVVAGGIYTLCKTTGITPDLKNTFLKPAAAAVVCGVLAFVSHWGMNRVVHTRLTVVAAIVIGGLGYVITLILTRAITENDILMFPKGEKLAKMLAKRGWIV